jgi:hypothetical protein
MQANTIVLSIRAEQADEFEAMFEAEELPVWRDLKQRGLLLKASLARVEFGSEEEEGVRHYAIYAAFESMAGHTAHDDDQRFNAFLPKARNFQPKSPLVFGGTTLFDADEL